MLPVDRPGNPNEKDLRALEIAYLYSLGEHLRRARYNMYGRGGRGREWALDINLKAAMRLAVDIAETIAEMVNWETARQARRNARAHIREV